MRAKISGVANFRRLILLGGLGLASFSFAQDLDSELELKPRARWVLEQGFAPQLLDCRLSDKSNLQCVASDSLLSVRCEATHFGRRADVQASFKGRAFSCEGTRFDKQSLMSQWKIVLKAENGSESVWIVDGADSEQLGRLYKTEMRAYPLLEKVERPFWSLGLANRNTSWGSDAQRLLGAEMTLGRNRWRAGAELFQALDPLDVEAKNLLRLSGALSLGSGEAGRGWVVGASSGHDFLKGGRRASSLCLGPEYIANPNSWRFSFAAGNCWFPASQVTLAPWASAGVKRKIIGPLFVTLDGFARSLTGSYKAQAVGGLEVRAQLGVSVAIAPQ